MNTKPLLQRSDFLYDDGVARWVSPEGADEFVGNTVGCWIHEELPDIERALEDSFSGEGSSDGIQVMAVELAVWRLHNRRDVPRYPVALDDDSLCVMLTEHQLDEVIAEANFIIQHGLHSSPGESSSLASSGPSR